jgi:MoaA/NifB/PqqE/SkfB family radical SAM enzyme
MELRAIRHTLKHSRFLLKHPRALIKALIGLFRTMILKQTRLRVIEWVINYECDSKCVFCYATKYNEDGKKPLTPAEIEKIWLDAEKEGAFLSIILGGEPTIRPDLDEVIKAMHPERNIIILVTNSLSLTRERVFELKKLGVAVFHLSLDGATAEVNDVNRGAPGHFDQVMRVVEWGKEAGIDVYFSSMLSHGNRNEFIKILEMARSMKIGVSGALVVTQGRYEETWDERLTEEDRKWIFDDLCKEYADVLRFDWNTNLTGAYECPAGREKVSVSLYGEIMSCVANHLGFGDLREEGLSTILRRTNEFTHFKDKNPKCLISFDTEYRRKYMDAAYNAESLPINIFDHPSSPAKLEDGKMIEAASIPELTQDEETYYQKSLEEHKDANIVDYASNSRYSRNEHKREETEKFSEQNVNS